MTQPVSSWETYKRLLSYVKPYWWALLASVLGYAIYSGTQPLMAEMMRVIVETLENPTTTGIVIICVAPAGIPLIQGIGQFIGSYSLAWVGQHVVYILRNEVFRHVLRLPLREFQQNASGRLMSKIIFDAQQVTAAGTDALTVLLREGLTVIGLLGYLFYKNWQLTLILFTVGPLIALVVNYASKRFRKIARRIQASMGGITHYLGEAIEGHQPVKIFSGQEMEEKRFHAVSRRFEKQNVKLVGTKVASTTLVQVVVGAGVGVIIYLYMQVLETEVAVGEFLAFVTAVGLIQKPLKQLTNINVKIQRGLTGAESLFEVLGWQTETDDGSRHIERAKGDIAFRDVSFSYDGTHPVLQNLTFEMKAGETIALVGRSGAGKSTVSAMIPRFYRPDSGEIRLDGAPLNDYHLTDLRRQIAMVTQKVVLFNDTVRNNIAYGELRDRDEASIIQAAKDAHAWDFIEKLPEGLDTEIGQDGAQLSGGQRQRLVIARALLKDAPILVLDEATSALDTESEHHIQQALEEVMRGRTTLVIAHRLSTIEKADRILVMDNGRVVEEGRHQELLAAGGAYAQLYKMNFREEQGG
jgi:subfamily B ATP-binding cassette protein MsbA